jgi:hypothetical protein
MTTRAQKLGPGLLTFGSAGTALDLTAQVTACRVTPTVNREDPTPTLDGGALPGETTYTWALKATLIQDLTDAGMFDYSWGSRGDEVPFEFTPSTAAGRTVTGTVIVDPLELGGDVGKKNNTTDLEWVIVGDPDLGSGL